MKTTENNQRQLKIIVLLITISTILFSCQNNTEQILTDYSWEIEKIVDLKTGMINQTESNQNKIWDFSPNSTYHYNTETENKKNLIKGKWQLDGNNLRVFNEFDSTKILVEKISTEEMVWLINENDSIRFYLSSKAKEMSIPTFPKTNEY